MVEDAGGVGDGLARADGEGRVRSHPQDGREDLDQVALHPRVELHLAVPHFEDARRPVELALFDGLGVDAGSFVDIK